ncbi:e3 ubiquitin-protein ligase amfr, partial [Chrysochromulina tobinii]
MADAHGVHHPVAALHRTFGRRAMGMVRSANERSLRVLHYLHHHSVLVLRSSSVFRAIEEGVRARPVSLVHALVSLAACSGCALSQGVAAPSLAATLVCVCRTRAGQVAVLSILLAIGLQVLRVMQYAVFGRLRVIEWQRFWERLVNFLMGQLIVLGAVVEPDLAEMVLWGSFTALVCLLGMYAGLARDRIEYMAHTPTPPSRAAWVRVVGLEVCLILIVLGAVVGGVALMHEASASMLTLFFFPAALLGAETSHALVLAFLQQRERHEGSSDLMYYASLLPELSLQLCRLLHQLHLWYAHGVSFSVIDVLLFANAKLAFEGLHRRVVTHRNFLRADANLQKLFRSASPEELANLDDCCAICREPMADAATVLPCGHYFHCTCLRSWLEQSHSCPVCRASLTDDPNGPPSTTGRAQHGLGAGAGVRTGVAGAVPAGATATAERAPPGMAPRPARRR